MKKISILLSVLILSACASPSETMTQEQVSMLSDLQLCEYRNNYSTNNKLEIEIGRRNLDCSKESVYCLKRGHKKDDPDFNTCRNTSRTMDNLMDLGGMILSR